MPAEFSGGCACGAIRYRCSGEPVFMGNCHCRDCQQASGSAYAAAVMVAEADFSLQSGEPSWYEKRSDAGVLMRRAFCSSCGSPVFAINEAAVGMRFLQAGGLDDPSWYEPSRDIYVASAQPWDVMNPDLPKLDGQ